MIRIIDNKKVEMTNDEWNMYQDICKSYDRTNFNGKDLFIDLFESDNDGILIMLRPPKTYTSMEVFMFIMALMTQQHLRIAHAQVKKLCDDVRDRLK